jgi:ankyrin repeat protein
LLQQKADVNVPLPDGSTALHWAVEGDDLETLELLIQAGANVKAQDRYGFAALYYACANSNAVLVERLLKAGANPNDADSNGDTVLMVAARTGNTAALKSLLDAGAMINARDAATQESALMWAVRSNHLAAVRLLLANGAEVNAATRIGKQPAVRPPGYGGGSHGLGIVRGGWPERGFQPETPGGLTPLLYAARDGRLEIAQAFLAAKAEINQDLHRRAIRVDGGGVAAGDDRAALAIAAGAGASSGIVSIDYAASEAWDSRDDGSAYIKNPRALFVIRNAIHNAAR